MATKALKQNKTFTYLWEGTNKRGEKVKGEFTASNVNIVKADLRRQYIVAKKIKKKSTPFLRRGSKRITQTDITAFSRQMATMLASGIPLIQAFDIVAKGVTNKSMQELVAKVKADVESGTTFAEALKRQPIYFNELFCNLVDAGEQSGSLDIMLAKVATYKEKAESLKGKIKKAMYYPAAVVVVAFIVTAALLIFVVPQFESLFKGFGAELPALTQMIIRLSEFFQAYWWLIFAGIGVAVYAFTRAHQRSKPFAHFIDRTLLQLPIIGDILTKAAIARFARTLAVTFAAGLPLVDALKSVAGATGNILYANATRAIRDDVSTGQQLQMAMRTTRLFPNMVIQMIAIGEESGSLEKMLAKVADFYEEQVDNAVDSLSSLLEPLIMIVLGCLVGGLVVAMYLPIFKMGSVI